MRCAASPTARLRCATGARSGTLPKHELTPTALTHLIVGSAVEELEGPAHVAGAPVLEVRGLRLREGAEPIDLHVGERELVAVIGLVGAGVPRFSAPWPVPCPTPARRSPWRDGRCASPGRAPPEARHRVRPGGPQAHRIAAGPVDRREHGAGSLSNWSRGGFTQRAALRNAARDAGQIFDIRCRSVDQPVGALSGGNQQKVLLGRWHLAGVSTLVVQEPSQGVDIGARHEIHKHLVDFAANGGRVLFSSSDIDEVRAIAHRIYVLHAGEISAVFDNTGPERLSRAALTEAMTTDARTFSHRRNQEAPA